MAGAPLGALAGRFIGDMSDGDVLGVLLLLPTQELWVFIDLENRVVGSINNKMKELHCSKCAQDV